MVDEDLKERIKHVKELENIYKQACHVSRIDYKTKDAFDNWIDAVIQLFSDFYPDDNEILVLIKNANCSGDGYKMYDLFNQIRIKCSSMITDIEKGRVMPQQAGHKQEQRDIASTKHPLVFISHSSENKELIHEFIVHILKDGLGLIDDNIICTSFEWTTVSIGENIPKYIQDNIEKADVVLAMVSKEYKNSEVCQNEVGAAWALNNRPISIVLPNASFKELGWLFNLDKATKINDEDCLNHLQKDLCERLDLIVKPSLNWSPCVKRFLESIKKFESLVPVTPSSNSFSDATVTTNSPEVIEHDKQLFETFNNSYSEDTIKYSLHRLQTTTKFSDYDLWIWLGMIDWLGKTSNAFLNDSLQNTAQKYMNCLSSLTQFTGMYYSPDHISWSTDNDHGVSLERWREIHEAKIYSWEPDSYDDQYRKLEQIILQRIEKIVYDVETAYKEFRLCVKNGLFV